MLARGGIEESQRRRWTAEEDEAIRRLYKTDRPGLRQLLPHRASTAIQQRASQIGTSIRPFWTDAEKKKLALLWDAEIHLSAIAKQMGRLESAVYAQAGAQGLPLGCPEGAEYVLCAAKRTGFQYRNFLRILEAGGVAMHLAHTAPATRGKKERRRYVDPVEVDAAVELWLKHETIGGAARSRGLQSSTLRLWLLSAGEITELPRLRERHRRVLTEVIDRVVAQHERAA